MGNPVLAWMRHRPLEAMATVALCAFVYSGCVLETSGLQPLGTSSSVGGGPSTTSTTTTTTSSTMMNSSSSNMMVTSSSAGGMGGGGGGAGGPVPGDLSGCILWLRADLDVSTVMGDVDAWRNQCGGQDATQVDAGSRPTLAATGGPNNTPAVDFNPSELDNLQMPFLMDGSDSLTVYAVFNQRNEATTIQAIIGADGTPGQGRMVTLVHGGGPDAGVRDGDTFRECAPPVAGQQWMAWELDASTLKLNCMRNGMVTTTDDYNGDWAWTGIPLLGAWRAGAYYMDASVAELVIFNRVLTATEKGEIEAYLLARYGL